MRRLLLTIAAAFLLYNRLSAETRAIAVPFFELEELKVSRAIAVGRFATLIDQRSLYALQLPDGQVLVRIDDVGRAPFDVKGEHLVYAHAVTRRVIDVNLTSKRRDDLWTIPAGKKVVAVHLVERLVRLTVEDAAGASETVTLPDVSPDTGPDSVSSEKYAVRPQRHDGRLFLESVALAATVPSSPTAPTVGGTRSPGLDVSAQRGLDWLERQLSKPFVSRHGRPARVIDSYEDAQRAGWIYDAALAAIAFTAAGKPALATDVLAGLEHLQRDEGSWVSSFDPDTASPRGSDRYVGAMAWVVMAVNFFEGDTNDGRFALMARRAL